MEWAMAIPRGQALEWVEENWGAQEDSPMADIWEVGKGQFGSVNFTRMYFGQEFCEKALPTQTELIQALAVAEGKGMKFTLVTPYVTEEGLGGVKGLLKRLAELKPQAEVVVNDWGVLQTIVADYPLLTPVLGRLLNKVLRDPRMMSHLKKSQGKTLESFRRSSLAGEPMGALLEQYDVRRIEMDFPPQGLDEQISDWGYD